MPTFLDDDMLLIDEVEQYLTEHHSDGVPVHRYHVQVADIGGISPVGVMEALNHEIPIRPRKEKYSEKHSQKRAG